MREIPGYEGLYAADENGVIWSLLQTSSRRKKALKPYANKNGYLRVNLFDVSGKVKHEYVHRLVARTFLPNPNGYAVVNHISADVSDNSVNNLEWCDQKYNIKVSREAGHQFKDIAVTVKLPTGEIKSFTNMREASRILFGDNKYWVLGYYRKTKGKSFKIGDLEVITIK